MLRSFIFALLLLLPVAANGNTVVSFDVGNRGGLPLAPTDTAGVVAVTNWNNLTGSSTTDSLLDAVDNSGTLTGIDISITNAEGVNWAGNTFHGQTPGSANARLLQDIAFENGAGDTFNVTFDDIAFDNYDVYLYTGAKFEAWGGSISNGDTSYFIRGPVDNTAVTGFIQGTETGSFADATSANYVKFSNLSGENQEFEFRVDAQQIYFAGAQIVSLDSVATVPGFTAGSGATIATAVPEPSSAIALLLIGAASVVRRRRRE